MSDVRQAADPLLEWWTAHEQAAPQFPLSDAQCVLYYKGIRVTAGQLRDLFRAIDGLSAKSEQPAAPVPQQ